eukprot:478804_1
MGNHNSNEHQPKYGRSKPTEIFKQQLGVENALDTLQSMFMLIDREVLRVVLMDQCQGNLDNAVEILSTQTLSPLQTVAQSNTKPEIILYDNNMTPIKLNDDFLQPPSYYLSKPETKATSFSVNNKCLDSQYLLTSSSFPSIFNNDDCNLQKCSCLRRICNLLRLYQKTIRNQDISNVYVNIDKTYNETKALNDFNHLLFCHTHQFEDIYNMNNKDECNLHKCISLRRNQRDRCRLTNEENILLNLYTDRDNIPSQQLLDRMHCYIFHTFDIGYKLTRKEKQEVVVTEMKNDNNDFDFIASNINKVVEQKRRTYRNVKRFHRLNANINKYSSIHASQWNRYSYGFRFFYWSYYKNNSSRYDDAEIANRYCEEGVNYEPNANSSVGDWYIHNKYYNIKDELLQNTICLISKTQWKNLIQTAGIHLSTNRVRKISCLRKKTAICYEMIYGTKIAAKHLIAIMVHSNYDEFQFKFGETFRQKDKNEKYDELKKRHSSCYWMARYLRECVECFGTYTECENIVLYHGVNQN